jgi:hypothetical protein
MERIRLGELFTPTEIARAYVIWCQWGIRHSGNHPPVKEISRMLMEDPAPAAKDHHPIDLAFLLCWIFEKHNGQTSAETEI